MISNVIRYNATNNPSKMAVCSQYGYPQAMARYAHIADHLELTAFSDKTEAKVEKLLLWIHALKKELGIAQCFKDVGVPEKEFKEKLDQLALDDQCTAANPRYPLVEELKEVLTCAYYGKIYKE